MAMPDAMSSARGGPSTHRAPARVVAGAPAVVKRNTDGASRAAATRQKWYSALTLTWLPLVVLVLAPLVVLSSQPYSHSTPSS